MSSASIKNLVSQLERKLEAAKKVQQALEEFPDLADLIAATASKSNGDGPGLFNGQPRLKEPTRKRRSSHFERIKSLFQSDSNAPKSIADICSKSNISRGAVSNLIYGGRKKYFERLDDGDIVLWRLISEEENED